MEPIYPNIRLGLCCMNIGLKHNEKVYASRTRIMKVIEKKGLDDAKNAAIDNVLDLAKMLCWNATHGIPVMRVSSDLVPHATNPKIIEKFGDTGKEFATLEFLRPYLEKVGEIARAEKMRLTFHPGPYNQIASPSMDVFNATVKDLDMHVKFFEMMGMDKQSIMVVHIGGMYCDKPGTIKRFKERFMMMPQNIRDRVVLENDEKCYDAEEVLEICESLNVPMVFDIFHYYCYKKYHPDAKQKSINELMPRILKTWEKRGIRPKVHLSEQKPNKPVGSHSVFVEKIPKEFLEIPKKYGVAFDIMMETKGKELAIGKLYRKYPKLKPKYTKDIPIELTKKIIKELELSEEPDDMANCMCDK